VKGIDIVFHLADLIPFLYSYIAPMGFISTNNLEGTLNVMQACREYGVEKIVHTSTRETYGTSI